MDFFVNSCADLLEITIDIQIRKSNNLYSITCKDHASLVVICASLCGIMLRTVNFYYQFSSMTVKIHDKSIYCFLTLKTHRITT